jgi:hypothetical protein
LAGVAQSACLLLLVFWVSQSVTCNRNRDTFSKSMRGAIDAQCKAQAGWRKDASFSTLNDKVEIIVAGILLPLKFYGCSKNILSRKSLPPRAGPTKQKNISTPMPSHREHRKGTTRINGRGC